MKVRAAAVCLTLSALSWSFFFSAHAAAQSISPSTISGHIQSDAPIRRASATFAVVEVSSGSNPAGFNWDDPNTWSDLATTVGVVGAAATLFIGWRYRKNDSREAKKKEQQEWAVRAEGILRTLEAELTPEVDPGSVSSEAFFRRDRLRALTSQLNEADKIFGSLGDFGDSGTRNEVLSGISLLIQQTGSLVSEYDWIYQLDRRLAEVPGDSKVSADLKVALGTAATASGAVLKGTGTLRKAIGGWLERSGASPPRRWPIRWLWAKGDANQ